MDKFDEELLFVNKIISGVTHELNNIFSTLNEIAGSLEDYFDFHQENSIASENIKKKINKIQLQIDRGKNLIKAFNQFSHQTDSTSKTFNLSDFIQQTILLHRYFANQKGVKFEIDNLDVPAYVTCNEFQLSFTIHKILLEIFKYQFETPTIEIKIQKEGIEFRANVSLNDPTELEGFTKDLNETVSEWKIICQFSFTNSLIKFHIIVSNWS
ncbi:MAG: hypothetical protein ACPLPX_04650 [Candidatus Kapaibacteriota bacterium]